MALALAVSAAHSQDALRGKRYYLDTARLTGASFSCVDCHRGVPPGLFGIGRAAGSPAIVAAALETIPQMAPLRGRLAPNDIADIAAYLADPAIASPALFVSTRSSAGATGSDRLDFGQQRAGAISPLGVIVVSNKGALPVRLVSEARIDGLQAADYALSSSNCLANAVLGPGESCEVALRFRPAPGSTGLRAASVQFEHDWVGGMSAVALLGTASN